MTNIFLAPRSNETSHKNFESTIIVGRSYKTLEPFLDDEDRKVLGKYANVPISIWGNKESLKTRWEKMKEGDFVLFYAKGMFYYSARVVLTKHSAELGKILWPVDEDGEPWTCLFFVDNLEKVEIPIKVVQELAEYEPTWDRVQGFMRLNDEGKDAIVEKFGSVEIFLSQKPEVYSAISKSIESIIEKTKDESLEEEKEEVVDKDKILLEARAYLDSGTSHAVSLAPHRVRIENKIQKKRIAELENYSCQVCGWSLEWINAKGKKLFRIDIDHITEKSKGGGEDLHNLWALCPNCHVKKTFNILKVDMKNKKVFENGLEIKLHHDFHLFV